MDIKKIPDTKTLSSQESMSLLIEMVFNIFNRVEKLETRINKIWLISRVNNPNSWSDED